MPRTGWLQGAALVSALFMALTSAPAADEKPPDPQFPAGNLAVNADCEKTAPGGAMPEGWSFMGNRERGEVRIDETIARSGKRSVFLRSLDGAVQGAWPWKQAAIYGNSNGLDGSRALPVVPQARYIITFFSRGRDNLKPENQPFLEVYLLVWTSEKGEPNSRKLLRRNYSNEESILPVTSEWMEHEVDFVPGDEAKRMALVFVPLLPKAPEETGAMALDLSKDSSETIGLTTMMAEAAIYIDDITITACDRWGLARHLNAAAIREGCEIPTDAQWQDSTSQPPPVLWSIPGDTPIELPKDVLDRPRYNSLPEGWSELDLGGAWKIKKLDETTIAMQHTEDPGTAAGYFKPEYDDRSWSERTVPSIWEGEDKLYPDGMVGYGNYRVDFQGIGWLRRRFTVPAEFKGRRLVLRFDGLDTEGTIYLNGVKLGKTVAPGVPSDFDATAAARLDGENVLAVRLYDANNIFFYDWYQWGRAGGIFKDVKLQARPDIYARQTLITPRLDQDLIEVEARIVNPTGSDIKAQLVAEAAPDPGQAALARGAGTTFQATIGERVLRPGETNLLFSLPMPQAERWSPDNPFLYILRLRTGTNLLAKERFGMRAFKRDGRFFTLNGERIYLPGCVLPCMSGLKAVVTDNRANSYRRLLAAYQGMGMQMFFSQGGVFNSDLLYEFCDEMGLMLYEWRGTIWPEKNWLENVYNHPAVVMFALGNETRTVAHRDMLNRAYEEIKRLDRQDRPVCSITGGAPKVVAPKSDFVDFHVYPGDINNHHLDMRDFILGYNGDTWVYHRENLPVVSWEMGGNRVWVLPEALSEIHKCLTTLPLDKKQLVRLITSTDPGYHMPAEARWLALYGIRRYVIDDWDKVVARGLDPLAFRGRYGHLEQYRQRYVVKGLLEECRRLGDLFQGYGINLTLDSTFGVRFPGDDPRAAPIFNIEEFARGGTLVTTDAYQDYRRCSQLHFVCADVIDKNVFAPGRLAFRIYAINDRPQAAQPWSLRVVLKDKAGKRLCDRSASIGAVPPSKRRIVPFAWDIPADLPGGIYGIEMFLLENGKVVSDNFDHFFVMPRTELATSIAAGAKRIALYDVGPEAAGLEGRHTGQVLDELKVPYVKLDDFNALDQYQVLMIGARSLDDKVAAAGEAIAKWVRSGGRLIQFEQLKPRPLPYLPQLSVVRRHGHAVGDLMEIMHPAFEGIRLCDNWDRWSGELSESWMGRLGGIYAALIGPLNQTVQASGILDTPRNTANAVAMLVSEVRMDKGLAFLSQAEATRRYGKDSVATRYLQNAIRHILSDETGYAYPLKGLHLAPVDMRQCGYLDLAKDATEKIGGLDPLWVKQVNQGMEDCGKLQFRWDGKSAVALQSADTFLQNEILIEMADRSRLFDPEWEKQKRAHNRDQGGLILTQAESLYFLHTAEREEEVDTNLPMEEIGEYIVTYADGASERVEIDTGRNINFRHQKKDAENARHVGHGFYVGRWINPHPEKHIRSIGINLKSETTRLVVLGITSTLVREKIHD